MPGAFIRSFTVVTSVLIMPHKYSSTTTTTINSAVWKRLASAIKYATAL